MKTLEQYHQTALEWWRELPYKEQLRLDEKYVELCADKNLTLGEGTFQIYLYENTFTIDQAVDLVRDGVAVKEDTSNRRLIKRIFPHHFEQRKVPDHRLKYYWGSGWSEKEPSMPILKLSNVREKIIK